MKLGSLIDHVLRNVTQFHSRPQVWAIIAWTHRDRARNVWAWRYIWAPWYNECVNKLALHRGHRARFLPIIEG